MGSSKHLELGMNARLTIYLSHKGYSRGGAETLFINGSETYMIVAQIYVDDIIFGGFSE